MKLETYIGFKADKTTNFFLRRNWPVVQIPVAETKLVKVTKGAALECGDGRFDTLEDREKYGIRVFGGINAIMALHTGGDENGFKRAVRLVRKFGAEPGTHSAEEGGCGYVDLWMAGELKSARYPYELNQMDKGGLRLGHWLRDLMRQHSGKHFRLNGNHQEEGVRLNPFIGYTEDANDGLRFRVDDWFMAEIGTPDEVRFFKIAETVEKLKPAAARLEIIIP